MIIPVVLFHKSEKYYVSCALRAAKNFGNEVTIITDVNPKLYSDYAKVVDFSIYKNEGAAQFEKVYQHFSTNPHYFEFTAIEKYFFLLEHMRKQQLEKILYIDSDLLLFENVTNVINKYYDSYDLCSCLTQQEYDDFYWSASGHLSLWSRQALEDFCAFILKVYTDKGQTDNLKRKWQWHLDNNISGGICDMTLIYLFLRETKLKTGNFLSVLDNQFSFDNALKGSLGEFPDEYEMKYSFLLGNFSKKISFKNGSPTCYNKLQKKDIVLYSLHCQAEAKRLMPLLVGGKKNFKEYIADKTETIPFIYGSLKREISKRIKKGHKK